MGKRGFLEDLCKALDCMEEEMHGLCRCFAGKSKKCAKPESPRKRKPEAFCLPPDFRPPCGKERCCCERDK